MGTGVLLFGPPFEWGREGGKVTGQTVPVKGEKRTEKLGKMPGFAMIDGVRPRSRCECETCPQDMPKRITP
jgi:hypothetical protein